VNTPDLNVPLARDRAGRPQSRRSRPVIAVIGEGSFQYSVQSIWTAERLRLPMLIVAMRNDEYAILKAFAVVEQTRGVPGHATPSVCGQDKPQVRGVSGASETRTRDP
jgi:hypothetical protein